MSDYSNNNTYRLALLQGETVLCERIYLNQPIRYSINIRDILRDVVKKFQKVLSRNNYDCCIERGEDSYYNLFEYNQKQISLYPREIQNDFRYNPEISKEIVSDTRDGVVKEKEIRGVKCKMGLYINEKPIVEREFYVDGFNPVAKFSVDVLDAVNEVGEMILNKIKPSDEKYVWDLVYKVKSY